jgi:glycosyltransferase involved in cell wall biosynthesis
VSETPFPQISIVTACLNRAGHIARAIDSVLAQAYPAVEHIVVDGGSTDGTLTVLQRFRHLRVVSERDRNLYDAINKGLGLARGEVVGLLNSDDMYPPGAFAAAAEALRDPLVEMTIGGAEFITVAGEEQTLLRRLTGQRATGLLEANAIGNVTMINSCFYRRSLLSRVGPFDIRFPICADKDFWMRLVLARPAHRIVPAVLYQYVSHGDSLTFSGADMRDSLSEHLLAMVRTKLSELPKGTPEYATYRRWHAWAAGYRALLDARRKRVGDMFRTARDAAMLDPIWPARFLARLPEHWRDRGIRHELPGPYRVS